MALTGKFLTEVQKYVRDLTERGSPIIVDAATGAGETTVQIAKAMKAGRLLTADNDQASWDTWALPSLEREGVADRVEFLRVDLRRDRILDPSSVDLIVSDATLSALGVYAVNAIEEFFRVLKAGGRLAIRDLLPEGESAGEPGNVASQSWRLAKAVAHLRGNEHYEELPAQWVKERLHAAGFAIVSFEVDPHRQMASQSSLEEWCQLEMGGELPAGRLKDAVEGSWSDLLARARDEGLTTKTGSYFCWAEK